ncbi:hypothetical protein BVI2075_660002 [Burkholderia vietnamiensis]|nr:hypothetical protein BVI2075_660002 [Burkholderia vietnamiensis]
MKTVGQDSVKINILDSNGCPSSGTLAV